MFRRILLVTIILAALTPAVVLAAPKIENPIIFSPEIQLPTFTGGTITVTNTTIAEYIRDVFIFFIWTVGILAVVVIIYGGIRWVAAAGNAARIDDARETVNNAVIGLVIALTSYVLLFLINPELTKFAGITISPVDPEFLQFEQTVVQSSGTFPSCHATSVSGDPSSVCSAAGCSADYNSWINQAASKYSIDPILVKAIIQQESPKNSGGQPFSGPGRVPQSVGSNRLTSSYGIGQWTSSTLLDVLRGVNGSVPTECNKSASDLRQSNGSLIPECATWLDQHLQLQVQMVAFRISEVRASRCVQDSNTIGVLGYHLGDGGADNFCEGKTLAGTTTDAAIAYVNQIEAKYSTMCTRSGG